jgi:hypothetical protein
MKQQQAQMQSSKYLESGCGEGKSKEIASSYVQSVMNQIKAGSSEMLREEVQVKRRQDKLRQLRKRKRTLTAFTPFELRTAKRIRLENQQSEQEGKEYEPLWL